MFPFAIPNSSFAISNTTIADALAHLRSCPQCNDPIEFIFGDLLARFTPDEERIVATLSYPTEPIPVTAIAEISGVDEPTTRRALKLLTNRSIVVPQEGEEKYALVPMVAEFIRHARNEVVKQMGDQLAKYAYRIIETHGFRKYDQFPVVEAAWASIGAALPVFLRGPNGRLQAVCDALTTFLNLSGRWDERLTLNQQAEQRAIESGDYKKAGWRATQVGGVHYRQKRAKDVLAAAERASKHWARANANPYERSVALALRGLGCRLAKNYQAALDAYQAALELRLGGERESKGVAMAYDDLGETRRLAGDLLGAERDARESLRIARLARDDECIAASLGGLAQVLLDRKHWGEAQTLSTEALMLAERVGSKDWIARSCRRLAQALMRQGHTTEAKAYAERAMNIYTSLGSLDFADAQAILSECDASR